MAISKSNLYEEAYNVVKDLITKYISDPTKAYKRKWIYSSMPDISKPRFKFPFIIINSPDISQENRDFNTGKGNTYRILITVWSDKESEVDELSSDIQATLINHESDLNNNNLYNPEINSSPFNMVLDQNGKKLYNRPIGIICRGWI